VLLSSATSVHKKKNISFEKKRAPIRGSCYDAGLLEKKKKKEGREREPQCQPSTWLEERKERDRCID
jgi:hypothetical protein